MRPAKTQISLGVHPVWSESSLAAWRKLGSLATYWAHSEDSDQTGRMPRLIWVFTGRTVILLVLSWGGSYLNSNVFVHSRLVALGYKAFAGGNRFLSFVTSMEDYSFISVVIYETALSGNTKYIYMYLNYKKPSLSSFNTAAESRTTSNQCNISHTSVLD